MAELPKIDSEGLRLAKREAAKRVSSVFRVSLGTGKPLPMTQEKPRPLSEWHEDMGPVLWWRFPIEEPPYVGTPLDDEWPDIHTYWTLIPVPEPPNE